MDTIVKELTCPSCGGKLAYDPSARQNVCIACGGHFIISPYETLDELAKDNAKSKCPNCGSILSFDPSTQMAQCPACDSSFIIIQENTKKNTDLPSVANLMFPFTVSQEQHQQTFIHWLSSHNYVPDDVYDKVEFITQRGVYIPNYWFTGGYDVDFSCEIGYDRKETYYERERFGTNQGKMVARTRTVTDWQPYQGRVRGNYTVGGCASEYFAALTDNSTLDECAGEDEIAQLPCFAETNGRGGQSISYDERYLSGFGVLKYDLSESEAYTVRAKPQIDKHIMADVEGQVRGRGNHQRNITWNGNISRKPATTYYSPFWITKYTYKNDGYICVGDGTSAERQSGSRPFSKDKRNKVSRFFLPMKIAIVWLAILMIIGIVSFFTSGDGSAFVFALLAGGGSTGATALYGFLRKSSFLQQGHAYLDEKKTRILHNQTDFFARQSSVRENEIYFNAVKKNWGGTALTLQAIQNDPHKEITLVSRIFLVIDLGMLIMSVWLAFSLGFSIIMIPLMMGGIGGLCSLAILIPVIKYKMKNPNYSYRKEHKREFIALLAIAAAFVLLLIIFAVKSLFFLNSRRYEPQNTVPSNSVSQTIQEASIPVFGSTLDEFTDIFNAANSEVGLPSIATEDWVKSTEQHYSDVGLTIYSYKSWNVGLTESGNVGLIFAFFDENELEEIQQGELPSTLAIFTHINEESALLEILTNLETSINNSNEIGANITQNDIGYVLTLNKDTGINLFTVVYPL